MTAERLIRGFYDDVITADDLSRVPELFSRSFVLHGPPGSPVVPARTEGLKDFSGVLGAFLQTFDVDVCVDEVMEEGVLAAARLTVTATQRKPFLGLDSIGGQAEYSATNFFRVEDGKIQEEWMTEDFVGMLMQLGCRLYGPDGKAVV